MDEISKNIENTIVHIIIALNSRTPKERILNAHKIPKIKNIRSVNEMISSLTRNGRSFQEIPDLSNDEDTLFMYARKEIETINAYTI